MEAHNWSIVLINGVSFESNIEHVLNMVVYNHYLGLHSSYLKGLQIFTAKIASLVSEMSAIQNGVDYFNTLFFSRLLLAK